MKNLIAILLFTPFLSWYSTSSNKEEQIVRLINAYRVKQGKTKLPLCDSLNFIAQTHAKDIYENFSITNTNCFLHSWSQSSKWRGGCIPQQGNQDWKIMWNKPKELLGMKVNGYEIAYMYEPKDSETEPERVVKDWIKSEGHRKCIVEEGWPRPFKRMGIGIYKGVTTVWFSE
jgi:uncharacterized protein YkwD